MLRTLIISLLVASAFAALDAHPKQPEIVARGVGRRAVPASIAVVRLGVSAQASTASGAQERVGNASNSLLAFLNENNVSKLGTTDVSLMPELNYSTTPPEVVGYSARNTISFEIGVTKAGILLDGAVAVGATRISSLNFKPDPSQGLNARSDALEDAVERARKEAEAVARGAGVSLGTVSFIEIVDSFQDGWVQSRSLQANSLAVETKSTTPVVPKDQIIVARVLVRFVIIPKLATPVLAE